MFNRAFTALRRFGFGTQRTVLGLDGLRAVSIAFVLVSHLTGTRHFLGVLSPLTRLGEFGVRIFFVISGYLITAILLDELQRKGNISLSRFYFRRMMRLFPASYFLIAVTAILAVMGFVDLQRWDLTFAITYTMNFYEARGWPLGHLWSLGVEEQFYILWPLTLLTLGQARSTRFLFLVLAVTPLLRLVSPYVGPAFNFLVWADALASGCLLALLREYMADHRGYLRVLASRWFCVVPICALAANYVPFTKIYWLASETFMNICIAATIDWAVRNPGGTVGRFLNLPAVSFMGVLSYSLYLWQQIFLNRYSQSPYCAFPLNIVLSSGAALISYLLIEAPFLQLRAAIQRIRVQDRRTASAA